MESREEVTIKELSRKIDVSSRTIHRDLDNIEKYLQSYHLKLQRKSGVGIQIVGSKKNKENVKRQLESFSYREYTVDERQTMILCTLYEAPEPVKLFTLANELRVAIATVSADLIKLEEQLKSFNLSIVKKRGYGIEISGSETSKRRAISYAIAKTLKEDEFLSLIKESIQKNSGNQGNSLSERLLHLVDREKLLVIEEVMNDLHRILPFSITDSAYIGLLVHLALAIERILLGESIEMDPIYLEQLRGVPEFSVARQIIRDLESSFQIDIPEAEIGYITMHLQGAKVRHHKGEFLEATNLQVYMQAKELVGYMEEATGFDMMDNEPLLEGLVTHLKPAIFRIRQEMGIANPLLPSIRRDYEDLFQIVKSAVENVFQDLHIPDEEIGFLVMHFGSVLLGEKTNRDLKAYIVCSSGIGTSKMLTSRLQREIPEIEEVKNISLFELNDLDITERDLLISTIHLPDYTGEYLIVSPFMTPEEVKQVQLYARRQALVQKKTVSVEESSSTMETVLKKLNMIHLTAGTMGTLLKNFTFTRETEPMSAEECIRRACRQLKGQAVIGDVESVVEALFERERISGIGIPNTQIAFYHTRHENVWKPSFSLHRLEQPITLKGMDGKDMEVSQLVLMLAPDPFHEPGLEVLSFISSTLIESEQSIELFESDRETAIQSFLARKFEQLIDEKTK